MRSWSLALRRRWTFLPHKTSREDFKPSLDRILFPEFLYILMIQLLQAGGFSITRRTRSWTIRGCWPLVVERWRETQVIHRRHPSVRQKGLSARPQRGGKVIWVETFCADFRYSRWT